MMVGSVRGDCVIVRGCEGVDSRGPVRRWIRYYESLLGFVLSGYRIILI